MPYCTMRNQSVLNFGKYKGQKVHDLIESDPQYIKWAIENTNCHPSETVLEKLKEKGCEPTRMRKQAKSRLKNKTI